AIAIDDQDRVKLSRKAALAERGQVDELAGRTRPAPTGGGDPRDLRGPAPGPPPRRPSGGDRDRDRDRDRGYGGDRGGPRGPARS
ncbi:MAG TPA: hypothetical protein VKA15_03800, partial [Isosphaeraceae bacterium]|nr:hypothetical protein [Isosphaeraceae bacterium]